METGPTGHFQRMTSREIFGLIVRSVGLFLVYQGLQSAVVPIAFLFSGNFALVGWLAPGVFVSAGFYFLRGAPELMRFSYPPED